MLSALYPLIFKPILKEKIWGGRKLESYLGRTLPMGKKIGESWEICDRELDQSIVANGPFSGTSLHELISLFKQDLMGHRYTSLPSLFPLLFKIIDADDDLSLQVHPGDLYAADHKERDPGKTEMWYVLQADPASKIYCGTSSHWNRDEFRRDLDSKNIKKHLKVHDVREGDVFFVPAGMVHAVGRGVFLIEIQENSDLTFRLSDWGRTEHDGRTRPLHIHEGLSVINPRINSNVQIKRNYQNEILVHCEYFTATHVTLGGHFSAPIAPESFQVWIMLDGSGKINNTEIQKGDFVLIPAGIGTLSGEFSSRARFLEVKP